MKSISILLTVIGPVIKFDVDKQRDDFRQELRLTLGFREQLSTFSALDLGRIHDIPHALPQENCNYSLPQGNQCIQNALRRIQRGKR